MNCVNYITVQYVPVHFPSSCILFLLQISIGLWVGCCATGRSPRSTATRRQTSPSRLQARWDRRAVCPPQLPIRGLSTPVCHRSSRSTIPRCTTARLRHLSDAHFGGAISVKKIDGVTIFTLLTSLRLPYLLKSSPNESTKKLWVGHQ